MRIKYAQDKTYNLPFMEEENWGQWRKDDLESLLDGLAYVLRSMKKDRLVEIASDIDALYVDKDDTEVKYAATRDFISAHPEHMDDLLEQIDWVDFNMDDVFHQADDLIQYAIPYLEEDSIIDAIEDAVESYGDIFFEEVMRHLTDKEKRRIYKSIKENF